MGRLSFNYSIIIPHKNIPELLIRCIKSIPVRDDIQVIVVDDNSDNANTYIEKYPELSRPNLEIYFTKEGKGAGYARNVGLKQIKGKWVMFADSDDLFLPEWTNITNQYLDSEVDVIQFLIADIISHSDCSWHNSKLDNYAKGKVQERDVLFSNPTCWAKMIKADLLRQNNILFDEVICANDVFFGYQVAVKANNIVISQSAIYDVTYREGSLTTIKNKNYSWIRYTTVKKANAYAAKYGFKRYELPHAIEVLKTWRQLGLRDFIFFIWHERSEIRRALKVQIDHKPFNYRHPYLYVLLVLLKLI